MSLLSARSLSVAYAGRTVLDHIDLDAGRGERLGLVGENGVGKSTLLRLLAGSQPADTGTVHTVGTVGFLGQEPDLGHDDTVDDAVDGALADFRRMEQRMRDLEQTMASGDAVLDEYGDLLEEYERRDGWSADARAAKALAGLGLGSIPRQRPVAQLSGGQAARLALALVLVRAPEVLLLDEPTNHLDDDALDYLEAALRQHPGAIVTASHDRAFLDAVSTSILDLDPALRLGPDDVPWVGPARYTGAYSDYLVGKAAALVRWEQAHRRWGEELDEARAAVRGAARRVGHTGRGPRDNDKFVVHFLGQKVDAAVARRVRDAEARVAKLEERRVPPAPEPLTFDAVLGEPPPDGVLVSLREIDVPGRVRVPALDITAETRLLVTGANGTGKSSLLEVVAGTLEPADGTVSRARRLRIGWLRQSYRFADGDQTALGYFARHRPGPPDAYQAELAALGLLPGRAMLTPVSRLSIGQQRRLALARVLAGRPHLLLLDEPTNHLSLTLVEELEAALQVAPQAVVVVTHDRWTRRRWEGDVLALGESTAVAGEIRGTT